MNITIYEYMMAALAVLAAAAIYSSGVSVLPHFAVIVAVASLADFLISHFAFREKILPKSAIITGMIIALILSPSSALWMQVAVPLTAIISKHAIKAKTNVFNPAAFALLAGGFFGAFPAWWAASSLLALPLGLFISWKIRKLEISLSFLAVYLVMFVLFRHIDPLSEMLGSAALFLAFFMATEPKTTPSSKNGKIVFGILLAFLALVIAFALPGIDFLLAALLIPNAAKSCKFAGLK